MRTGENIYKRKDGRWEARYYKGRDSCGKIIYGFCYGKTYSEAKKKAEDARQAPKGPQLNAAKSPEKLFSAYCDEWLLANRLRLKESTYVKYNSVIQKYIKPGLGAYLPADLTSEMVREFGNALVSQQMLSAKTAKDILVILHSVLEYTAKQNPGEIGTMDMVYPKEISKEMRVLSVSEQTALTAYLLTDLNDCKFGVLLAMWTGLRIGELCALRWDHISLSDAYIRIDSTMQRLKNTDSETGTKIVIDAPKSASSVRIIPLNRQTFQLCEKMVPRNSSSFVLTGTRKYMEPRVLQYHFRRYTDACGLQDVHFHTLRHTFATRCVEVGFEIKTLSEILGHANTSITLNRYVHCSMQLKRENMDKLESVGV